MRVAWPAQVSESQAVALPSITTRNETPAEVEAANRLANLLERIDLSRFAYTDQVIIDADAPRSHSHPVLTLRPDHILGPPGDVTVATYLHEQMHWAANTFTGFGPAIDDVSARWPDPPGASEGGAADDHSTWLHFPVCALEIAALTEVLGEDRARATIRSLRWYRWIYGRLLGVDLPWRGHLARHGLVLPAEPPRHRLDVTWVLGADVAKLRAAVGRLPDLLASTPLEPDLIVRIVALCCLTMESRDAASAAAIDRRNARPYPELEKRRDEVDRAIAQLRPLRHGP